MNSIIDENGQNDSNSKKIFKYTLKTIAFIVFLTLSPVIFLAIIWIGFKLLVLNDSIDIKPMLEFAASKLKVDKKEEIDISELNEDDIVMVDVEDITDRK